MTISALPEDAEAELEDEEPDFFSKIFQNLRDSSAAVAIISYMSSKSE